MASYEGIGSPFLKQPSARSPKLGIYESLFLLNEGMDHDITLLREMEKLPFADRESVQCAVVEIEEVRCDMNADFTEKLADSERFDEGRFWKQKRAFEKKWRDTDDVYISTSRAARKNVKSRDEHRSHPLRMRARRMQACREQCWLEHVQARRLCWPF